MAYARRTKTATRKKASPQRSRAPARRTSSRPRARASSARTGGRTRSAPSTIRIQLVQAAPQELSPVTRALMEMGRVTPPPRKAKF